MDPSRGVQGVSVANTRVSVSERAQLNLFVEPVRIQHQADRMSAALR